MGTIYDNYPMIIKFKWVNDPMTFGHRLDIIDYHLSDPEHFIELKYISNEVKRKFATTGYYKRSLGAHHHIFLNTDFLHDPEKLRWIKQNDGLYDKVDQLREGIDKFQRKLRNDKLKELGI